jgi:hypothetical protein
VSRKAKRREAAQGTPTEPSGRKWRLIVALVVGAVCVGPLASAINAPLSDWDGRLFWSAQAAYMRADASVDSAVLTDVRWSVSHPQYPPLLSLDQLAVQEFFGATGDQQFYRALYVGVLVALLLVINHGAGVIAGRNAAALITLCVAVSPILSYGSGGATSAYSDLALAGFFGGGLVLLIQSPMCAATAIAAGGLLAGAVLTKNEGSILAVVSLLLASVRLIKSKPSRADAPQCLRWLAAAALPVVAGSLLLASWRAGIPNRQDEAYFATFDLAAMVRSAVSHWLVILREMAIVTLHWSDWHGFWLVYVIVVVAGWRALRRSIVPPMILAGLAPPSIGLAAYLATTRLPILIDETWSRFLIQALVPLSVVLAAAIGRLYGLKGEEEDPGSRVAA